jgi:hypothetical protein
MLLHIFICFDWFISRRKLFQKSFENVFEVLEKKKEKGNNFFLGLGRKPSFSPRTFSLGQPRHLLLSG